MEIVFKDADSDYLQWIADHPDGFVLNTYRSPRANYLRLHTASCRLVNGRPANGDHWTVNYIKVCGSRKEVADWGKREAGGEVWACSSCLDH